ncbi:MAG: hypothetical protein JNL12_21195 [Planctomycetes bacterium]|nr:hypothetical protein [Planctomycetota bacterium]
MTMQRTTTTRSLFLALLTPVVAACTTSAGANSRTVNAADLTWLDAAGKGTLVSERKRGRSSSWRDFDIDVRCCRSPKLQGDPLVMQDYVFSDGQVRPAVAARDLEGEFLQLTIAPPAGFGDRLLWFGVVLKAPAFEGVLLNSSCKGNEPGMGVRVLYPLPSGKWIDGAIPWDVVSFATK